MKWQRPIWFYAMCLLCVVLVFNSGCNPAKRLQQQQEQYQQLINDYLDKHPLKSDTVTTVIKGGIDSVFIPVPVTDTAAIAKAKDSLQIAIRKKYQADNAECSRQVNEAFETGRKHALYEFSQQKIPKPRPDTVKVEINNSGETTRLTNETATLKGQLKECRDKKNWFWYFIASVFLNGVLITALLKRK